MPMTLDDFVEPDERAAANEKDVAGVDLQEVLLRMLASAFGRHVGHRALDDLQQRLLDAFATDVAGDGWVVALARHFVDFIDVDDAALRAFDVVVGVLQQLDDDVLDVLAYVSRFGEGGRVGDCKWHVQDSRQRLCQEGLAGARGTQQKDVRFLKLDVVRRDFRIDALVVVVYCDGENLLRALLPDDVFVEDGLDLGGLWKRRGGRQRLFALDLFGDDVVAEPDALVTDVDRRTRDELLDLFLGLATERTLKVAVSVVSPAIHHLPARVSLASRPFHGKRMGGSHR